MAGHAGNKTTASGDVRRGIERETEMKVKKAQAIRKIWNETEKDFPSKSTEFLLEVTARRCYQSGWTGVDCSDVAEALKMTENKMN